MDAGTIIAMITCIFVAAGCLGGVIGWLFKFSARIAQLEQKIEIIWDFLMKRALSEAATKAMGTINSPLTDIRPDVREWFSPELIKDLRQFYADHHFTTSEMEYEMLLHREFGERIFKEVCIPHELIAGSCVPLAVALSKEP